VPIVGRASNARTETRRPRSSGDGTRVAVRAALSSLRGCGGAVDEVAETPRAGGQLMPCAWAAAASTM